MRFAFRGNHSVSFSTESEVVKALWGLGHEVDRIQEADVDWPETVARARAADVFLWVSTQGNADRWDRRDATNAVRMLNDTMPTLAVHLDRFWGLSRERRIHTEPWFRLRLVATADGGHDDRWAAIGVNHRWFPPAVSVFECGWGERRPEYTSEIAFVGSWAGYGHTEWHHRHQLVKWLRQHYGKRLKLWPEPDRPAIRGEALRDLYASVDIAVGDSCMVGDRGRYWSDRIPETLGRGAFLLHPDTPGLAEHFTDGKHLVTWQIGVWDDLVEKIEWYLSHPAERAAITAAGREHVMREHTYTKRMADLIADLEEWA